VIRSVEAKLVLITTVRVLLGWSRMKIRVKSKYEEYIVFGL
jgi:hypothetical protein